MEVRIPLELARFLHTEAEKMVTTFTYEYHSRLRQGKKTGTVEYRIRLWRRVAALLNESIKDATTFINLEIPNE